MARHTAFDILYQEYYVRIFGLCRKLLNSSDRAEDAAQETFMRAYNNFGKFDSSQPFWAWIAAIANNHCIDQLRKSNRRKELFGDETQELNELTDVTSSQEPDFMLSSLIRDEDADSLNEAISALPDKYRIPIVLAYFNQLSYDAIAHQLEITKSHVGVLLIRGKKLIRTSLAEAREPNRS